MSLTIKSISQTLTIQSISQIRFLPGQKLSLKLPQSSTAILAALDAAAHAFDTTEVKTPYHFFNTTGAHIALEEQYNATTVLFVSNADYIDDEFAKLLITGEVSLSPHLKKESLLLLRHLYNFNIDWRVVLTGQEFWKTELSDHYKKIFNQDSLDFQNTSQRNLFDSNSAALLAAHKAIQQLKTDVPPTLFKNVPPSLPTYLVGIFATMQDLHFGCGIIGPKHITEQDWTRRVWSILIDSLFSFAPTFIQSSNANLKDEARRPDHRISLRISPSEADAVLLIATEDQKEKFVDPWLHKDFRKLIRTLRKALRSILACYPGGTDLQVFGILFGGPCVCILKMTATTYTPSKRNPDGLPRPVFHLALSPVWSFEVANSTPKNLTEYLSAISEVYAYAVGLTEVKRRTNSILGSSEMPIQGAMSGGKRRKYPTTFIQPLVAKRSRSGDEDDEEKDQEGDGDDEGKGDEERDGESDA